MGGPFVSLLFLLPLSVPLAAFLLLVGGNKTRQSCVSPGGSGLLASRGGGRAEEFIGAF